MNKDLFLTIYNLSGKSEIVDSLMIFGAVYLIFVTAALMAILFFKGVVVEKKALFLAILSFTLSYIIVEIIRLFFIEPRPFVTLPIQPLTRHVTDASFPSTHTSTMATIAFSYLFYRSKYALIFVVFMLWVGFARIFVGVHYPLDILGGIGVGLLSTFIAWQFKNYFKKKLI